MKNLVFCVITLMAFSFASNANEVNETTELQKVVVEDECVEASFAAADAIQAVTGVELTAREEGHLILALYDLCDANR